MADWVSISGLATAAGTFALAVTTAASVRSANRSARVAEEALLAAMRPLVVPSRLEDPAVEVGFADGHFVRTPGGAGTVEVADSAVYLTASLRNVGTGIAVLHGWRLDPGTGLGRNGHPDLESFRPLTRDLYLAPGEVGFWQGAVRDADDPLRELVASRLADGGRLIVDILYGDSQGGQRVISRFSLIPTQDGRWLTAVARHWNVDRPDPR